jgi:hypothetical protein
LSFGRRRWRESWLLSLRPLALFVASRVGVVLVVGATALTTHRTVMRQLVGWDSKWYLMIAERGYAHAIPAGSGNAAQSDLGFFPLLPLLIRAVHELSGLGYPVAGLVTTTILGLGGSVAVWWLLDGTFGKSGADRGTAMILLSPAAFVLSMVYSEGAIILFVACTLLALRRRRWWLAGLLAALATATDPIGCAAIVPCVVACTLAIRREGEWRALAAPVIAPLGVGVFFVFLWRHTGSPLTYLRAQRAGWQRGTLGGAIPKTFENFWRHGFHDVNVGVKAMSALAALLMLLAFFRAHPLAPWIGYVGAVIVMGVVSPVIGITPRLLLRGFPLVGVTGARLPPVWFEVVLGLSALCLAALTVASASPWWTP